jgi:hypothetical protein
MNQKNISLNNFLSARSDYALSVEQSNALKGVAILCVILGHNHILAPVSGMLFGWLYSFHLVIFFILPFFYNKSIVLTSKVVKSTFVKNYIPFVLFFILHYCLFVILIEKKGVNFSDIAYALFNGSSRVLKETSGFVFLWFLPAYFSFSLVRMLSSKNKFIFLGLFMIGMGFSLNWNYSWNVLFVYIPFGLAKGIYYFTFGVITLFLVNKVPYIKYIGAGLFIVLSTLYWLNLMPLNEYLLGISGFLFFMSTVDLWKKIPGVQFIGKYSLGAYLFHVLICNFLERLLPNTLLHGWFVFLMTIFISLLLSWGVMNIEILKKFIFPRNLSEWLQSIRIKI